MVLARKGKLSDRGVHFLLPEVRHSPGPTQTRPDRARPGQTRPDLAKPSWVQPSAAHSWACQTSASGVFACSSSSSTFLLWNCPSLQTSHPRPLFRLCPRPASAFLINVARFYHKFYTPLAIFRSFLWPQLAQGINMSIYTSVYTLYMYIYLSV